MRTSHVIEKASERDTFDDVTEDEIIFVWSSFKAAGLSGDEAWHAIVTGMALNMAFARSKGMPQIEQ